MKVSPSATLDVSFGVVEAHAMVLNQLGSSQSCNLPYCYVIAQQRPISVFYCLLLQMVLMEIPFWVSWTLPGWSPMPFQPTLGNEDVLLSHTHSLKRVILTLHIVLVWLLVIASCLLHLVHLQRFHRRADSAEVLPCCGHAG